MKTFGSSFLDYYGFCISRELEKQLIICESEKINLQNQLHDEQRKVHKCVCNNQVLKEKMDSSRLCEEYNFEEESNTKTKLDDAWKVKDDSCIIIEPVNSPPLDHDNTFYIL